jgi:hypothetical protein
MMYLTEIGWVTFPSLGIKTMNMKLINSINQLPDEQSCKDQFLEQRQYVGYMWALRVENAFPLEIPPVGRNDGDAGDVIKKGE